MDTLENAQKRSEFWKAESLAASAEIDRLRAALREAEAGLIFAGADVEPSGNFVPSPTAALRIVRAALLPNAEVSGAGTASAGLPG